MVIFFGLSSLISLVTLYRSRNITKELSYSKYILIVSKEKEKFDANLEKILQFDIDIKSKNFKLFFQSMKKQIEIIEGLRIPNYLKEHHMKLVKSFKTCLESVSSGNKSKFAESRLIMACLE
ncbi:MAG: hypothetical protein RsTaC01_0112 [Candidatus Paraimprobicoccus trichonymphae]|uniref:Uncharacterized protein n=1 Tax=Candidatus Paraimprobicoccus trichonymphae TaxID=3033793 RepID=A0AA48HW02_9FIRM|nr:MAG: hypothetical protein RsTaC01_0112 [Candidatus Paraimprobicoccus trichonymphae]